MHPKSNARHRNSKRQKRGIASLQDTGIRMSLLRLGFLLLPMLFGVSPMLKVVASGLNLPGWLLLGAGMVMLGVVQLRKGPRIACASLTASAVRVSADAELWSLKPHELDQVAARGRPPSRNTVTSRVTAARALTPVTPPLIELGRHWVAPVSGHQMPPAGWNAAVFAAIEWRRFEAVCEALFAQAGFRTESQSHGADGGVDIWLYSANAVGVVAIAQCKHWTSKPVGVKEMREFFGVMASQKLQRGTYATTSTYTADARQFAKANRINAMDGEALLKLIASRTPEQQAALLAVAFEGEYWRPTCASCGTKTVERQHARSGAFFWGCSSFPRCRTRFAMTAQPSSDGQGELATSG